MTVTKDYGYKVQVLFGEDWKTVTGCDRNSGTFSAIRRAQKKHPELKVRVVCYDDVEKAEYIDSPL